VLAGQSLSLTSSFMQPVQQRALQQTTPGYG